MRPTVGLDVRWRAALALVVVTAAAVWAEPHVFIEEVSDEDLGRIDLDDVSVEDWIDVVGEATLTAGDFHFASGVSSKAADPASFDFRLWLAWHDGLDRLYCAVEVVDDVYLYTYRRDNYLNIASLHEDAYVWFMVDGDRSGDNWQATTRSTANRGTQVWFAIPAIAGAGRHIELQENGFSYGADWFLHAPVVRGGGGFFSERPTVIVNEFYVTPFDVFSFHSAESSRVTDLRAGLTIGLEIGVIDRDEEGGSSESFYWSQVQGNSSAGFGTAVLLPRGARVEVDADPLMPESWGEIKERSGGPMAVGQ